MKEKPTSQMQGTSLTRHGRRWRSHEVASNVRPGKTMIITCLYIYVYTYKYFTNSLYLFISCSFPLISFCLVVPTDACRPANSIKYPTSASFHSKNDTHRVRSPVFFVTSAEAFPVHGGRDFKLCGVWLQIKTSNILGRATGFKT